MRYLLNVTAALGLVGTISTAAIAGPTYSFALDQTQASGLSGPFGTVTLTQNGANSVNVLVDLNPAGSGASFGFLNSGGPHTPFAFNLSPALTSGLSATFTQPSGGSFSANGKNFTFGLNTSGGGATPYGTFSVAIDITPVNSGSSYAYFGDLGFTLTRAGGLSTTDFGMDTTGSPDAYFAADLTDGTNSGSVAAITSIAVPEPASLLLLSIGMVGTGIVARRRRRAAPTPQPVTTSRI